MSSFVRDSLRESDRFPGKWMMTRVLLPSLVAITVAPMARRGMEICAACCHTPSDSCYRNFSLDKKRPSKGNNSR